MIYFNTSYSLLPDGVVRIVNRFDSLHAKITKRPQDDNLQPSAAHGILTSEIPSETTRAEVIMGKYGRVDDCITSGPNLGNLSRSDLFQAKKRPGRFPCYDMIFMFTASDPAFCV
jgi:hypothetical protein